MATLAASAPAEPVARFCGYVTHCAASGSRPVSRARRRRAVALARCRPPGLVARRRVLCVLRGAARLPPPRASGAVRRRRLGRAHAGGAGVSRRAVAAGTLRVVFLDVGQGDATLAILPDGRALLVDAGGLAGSTLRSRRARPGSVGACVRRTTPGHARRDPRRSRSHRRRAGRAAAVLRRERCGKACPFRRTRVSARSRPPPPPRPRRGAPCRPATARSPPGSRFASCTRRRPSGSVSASATTTPSSSSSGWATCRSCCPATSAAKGSGT